MGKLFSLSEFANQQKASGSNNNSSKSKIIRFEEIHIEKIENIKNLCGHLPIPGEIIFLWTCNSFNAFTFIPYVIRYSGKIQALYISTYSINTRIVEALFRWYDKGDIEYILIYISDSMKFRMPAVVDLLEAGMKERNIQIKYAWNHSKIQLIKSNDNCFVVEGSGNFSENAANEQYVFLNNIEVYEFRKKCFEAD